MDVALFDLSALPSAAKERSSLAATINLNPPLVGMFMTSTYIFEKIVAGVETVIGICTLRVFRIWQGWQEETWWSTSALR